MGEPTEHHMAELGTLTAHGLVEDRVAVTMDLAPPRGHAINDLVAVFPVMELQPDPVGGRDGKHRIGPDRRSIGVPDMTSVVFEKMLFKTHSEEC